MCDLHLPYNNLSKQHCRILIDNNEHFIMDLNSRNKTHRNTHCLRPNTYYELTNGIQLKLADLDCQYFIGDYRDDSSIEDEELSDASTILQQQPGDTGVEETPLALVVEGGGAEELRGTSNDDDTECKSVSSSVSTRTPSPQLTDGMITVAGRGEPLQQLLVPTEVPLPSEEQPPC